MTWVKVDDKAREHLKHRKAGTTAWALWNAALGWCADNLTDGTIPAELLPDTWRPIGERFPYSRAAETLVSVGLWHRLGDVCSSPECPACADGELSRRSEALHNSHSEARNGTQIFVVHDYFAYQDAREDVIRERTAARDRMRKRRGKTANQAQCSGEQPENFGRSSRPPSRPVPSRPIEEDDLMRDLDISSSRGDDKVTTPATTRQPATSVQSTKTQERSTALAVVPPAPLELSPSTPISSRELVDLATKRWRWSVDVGAANTATAFAMQPFTAGEIEYARAITAAKPKPNLGLLLAVVKRVRSEGGIEAVAAKEKPRDPFAGMTRRGREIALANQAAIESGGDLFLDVLGDGPIGGTNAAR